MNRTKIEWCDFTWNPVTGCLHGCEYCYARQAATRFYKYYERPFAPAFRGYRLVQPSLREKPARIFVCSMGDLFYEHVDTLERTFVLDIMIRNPQHTFVLLTKRAMQMKIAIVSYLVRCGLEIFPKHIWVGVTAENQEFMNERTTCLEKVPAAVRFVSVEPMLEPVEIPMWLDWVICGMESGPGRRSMSVHWATDLCDQCAEYNIPFFYKQGPGQLSALGQIVKMPKLYGQVWDQIPEVKR